MTTTYRIRTSTGAEINEDSPAYIVTREDIDGYITHEQSATFLLADYDGDDTAAYEAAEQHANRVGVIFRPAQGDESAADEYGGRTVTVGVDSTDDEDR